MISRDILKKSLKYAEYRCEAIYERLEEIEKEVEELKVEI